MSTGKYSPIVSVWEILRNLKRTWTTYSLFCGFWGAWDNPLQLWPRLQWVQGQAPACHLAITLKGLQTNIVCPHIQCWPLLACFRKKCCHSCNTGSVWESNKVLNSVSDNYSFCVETKFQNMVHTRAMCIAWLSLSIIHSIFWVRIRY